MNNESLSFTPASDDDAKTVDEIREELIRALSEASEGYIVNKM